jgi:Domain of unknown function (DUF317)
MSTGGSFVPDTHDRGQKILVHPRYLAGPYEAEIALRPLRELGWSEREGHLGTTVRSPCRRVRVNIDPQGPARTLWTITAHRSAEDVTPVWTAIADDHTPEEILRGLIDAIAADPPLPGQEHPSAVAGPTGDAHTVYAPVADAGWSHTLSTPYGIARYTAPDRLAGLVHRLSTEPATPGHHRIDTARDTFAFWGGVEGAIGHWRASFSAHTPSHLIAGFATALADPTPVLRTQLDVPRAHRAHVVTVPVPPAPRAEPGRRVQVATARSPQPPAAQPGSPMIPAQRQPPPPPAAPSARRR